MIDHCMDASGDRNNFSNSETRAISAVLCQNEADESFNDIKRRVDITRQIKCYGKETWGNVCNCNNAKQGTFLQTNAMEQMSTKWFTNKVREVFGHRLESAIITGVGYYVKNVEFCGEVQIVDENNRYFVANVINMGDQDDRYEAKFDLDEVSSADIQLVRPGAMFYWTVGREITNGTERNISQILFRRMASIGKKQMRKIADNAKNKAESIRRAIVEA